MRAEGVTGAVCVPTVLQSLLDALPEGQSLPLRRVLYGAAPISELLLRAALKALPDAGFVQFYGQTEVAGACTALLPEDHWIGSPVITSAGRATLFHEIRIADAQDRPVPFGTLGEIQVRTPARMTGYRDDGAQTAVAIVDGWVKTGDAGRMNAEGYVWVVERLKDMIVSGGENIFAGEVELALVSHPAVAQAAVVGVPDARWGEVGHASVILHPGARTDTAALIAHCRTLIGGYKVPRHIRFVSSFPRSAVGKLRKDLLRIEARESLKDGTE